MKIFKNILYCQMTVEENNLFNTGCAYLSLYYLYAPK